jgi:outer membrane protein assembly factor BamB
MSWYGYSVFSGQQVWGPTTPYPQAFGFYSWQASAAFGYLLALDFAGYVHAFDMKTGVEAWTFFTGSSGTTTAYGTWVLNNPPPTSAGPQGSGLIYVVAGHAYNPPIYPGAQIYCINATNGKLVWSELGFYTYDPVEVADGVLVCYNCYDGQVYAYGQGPSATTVKAPEVAVQQGTQVLLTGTVTDQSPGQTSLGKPAAGTPAISDDNMSAWQAYLYMQQPKPNNAIGVPVHLTAIDPNNNWQDIGTAISDDHGMYSIAWVPPVPGTYKVTATFAGSNSYYSSDAETAFIVSKAVAAAPAVTAAPTAISTQAPTNAPTATIAPTITVAPTPSPVVVPPASGMPTATFIAIGAVIIIVLAAAAALILRRRK